MKQSKRELDIENSIFSFLNVIGAYSWKVRSVGVFDTKKKVFRKRQITRNDFNGVSDISGIFFERPLAIEVKDEDGVLSPDQRKHIARFNAAGGIAFVARSVHQVAEELGKHFPSQRARFYAVARQLEVPRHGEH